MTTDGNIQGAIDALETSVLRHLAIGTDDTRVSILAEELMDLFERIEYNLFLATGGGSYDRSMVDAATLAMRLLSHVPQGDAFPRTINVLWGAVIKGWLAKEDALPGLAEQGFARCIAETKLDHLGTNTRNKMLARIREGLDVLDTRAAFRKVLRFLQAVDREKDCFEIVQTVARTFGRYASLETVLFAACVIVPVQDTRPEVMTVVTPIMADAIIKEISRLTEVGADLLALARHLGGNCRGFIHPSNPWGEPCAVFEWDIDSDWDVASPSPTAGDLFQKASAVILAWRRGDGHTPYNIMLNCNFRKVRYSRIIPAHYT